jgi:hypothetical protein
MSENFHRDVLRSIKSWSFMCLMPVALTATVVGLTMPAAADQGCEDMRQLCKEATAGAAKCAKQEKSDAPPNCKPLIDVREATCAQVEIICKPPVGEPK